LARLARNGDTAATQALTRPMTSLGHALAPWIERFGATIVTVGGAMTQSWDLVGPPLTEAVHAHRGAASVTVAPAGNLEHAALIGAALWAGRTQEHTSN
jgi:glucokinase